MLTQHRHSATLAQMKFRISCLLASEGLEENLLLRLVVWETTEHIEFLTRKNRHPDPFRDLKTQQGPKYAQVTEKEPSHSGAYLR